MNIGLFGGTFDPVHTGHLILAETIRSDYPLDHILFIPAAVPPHKQDRRISDEKDRVRMLKAALKNHPHFSISPFELDSGGISYTIDTVKHFQSNAKPGVCYTLIIGGDSLTELDTWKSPDELLNRIEILVVKRPDYPIETVDPMILEKVTIMNMPLIEISSSEIRDRVRSGRSIRYQVPEKVEKYIRKRNLYQ